MAIDPGERHCGVAWFTEQRGEVTITNVEDTRPDGLYRLLEECDTDQVVVEEFRLYPWKMEQQGMKEMKTSEVIGVAKYICSNRGLALVQQPANIKVPTRAIMKTLGLDNPGRNMHMRDAVEHGYHWMFRNTDMLKNRRKKAN